MKRRSRVTWIVFCLIILSGCGSKDQNTNEISQEEALQEVAKQQEEKSEIISSSKEESSLSCEELEQEDDFEEKVIEEIGELAYLEGERTEELTKWISERGLILADYDYADKDNWVLHHFRECVEEELILGHPSNNKAIKLLAELYLEKSPTKEYELDYYEEIRVFIEKNAAVIEDNLRYSPETMKENVDNLYGLRWVEDEGSLAIDLSCIYEGLEARGTKVKDTEFDYEVGTISLGENQTINKTVDMGYTFLDFTGLEGREDYVLFSHPVNNGLYITKQGSFTIKKVADRCYSNLGDIPKTIIVSEEYIIINELSGKNEISQEDQQLINYFAPDKGAVIRLKDNYIDIHSSEEKWELRRDKTYFRNIEINRDEKRIDQDKVYTQVSEVGATIAATKEGGFYTGFEQMAIYNVEDEIALSHEQVEESFEAIWDRNITSIKSSDKYLYFQFNKDRALRRLKTETYQQELVVKDTVIDYYVKGTLVYYINADRNNNIFVYDEETKKTTLLYSGAAQNLFVDQRHIYFSVPTKKGYLYRVPIGGGRGSEELIVEGPVKKVLTLSDYIYYQLDDERDYRKSLIYYIPNGVKESASTRTEDHGSFIGGSMELGPDSIFYLSWHGTLLKINQEELDTKPEGAFWQVTVGGYSGVNSLTIKDGVMYKEYGGEGGTCFMKKSTLERDDLTKYHAFSENDDLLYRFSPYWGRGDFYLYSKSKDDIVLHAFDVVVDNIYSTDKGFYYRDCEYGLGVQFYQFATGEILSVGRVTAHNEYPFFMNQEKIIYYSDWKGDFREFDTITSTEEIIYTATCGEFIHADGEYILYKNAETLTITLYQRQSEGEVEYKELTSATFLEGNIYGITRTEAKVNLVKINPQDQTKTVVRADFDPLNKYVVYKDKLYYRKSEEDPCYVYDLLTAEEKEFTDKRKLYFLFP